MGVRRRPTLPQPGGCSTIGAEGLSFRVRDGTGRFPFAVAAVTLWNLSTFSGTRTVVLVGWSWFGNRTVDASKKVCVVVKCSAD